MNHNKERYEASQSAAKLFCDGMISVNTKKLIIEGIASATSYTFFDVYREVDRLIDLYEEAELV